MLTYVHPNPDGKSKVLAALDRVLLELKQELEESCNFSDNYDTSENVKRTATSFRSFHKKVGLGDIPPATPEELDQDLNLLRDRTSMELGHRERRIHDVDALRKAVQEDTTTQEDLKRVQELLISSVMRAAVRVYWMQAEEDDRVKFYTEALVEGFCVNDWDCFPYDELPLDFGK